MIKIYIIAFGLACTSLTSCTGNKGTTEVNDGSDVKFDEKVKLNEISNFDNKMTIDSQRISDRAISYTLFYNVNGEKIEIYNVLNQDYSIEFKKKYVYVPLIYTCFEISDLPTGLTWDILFDNKSKSFFITDKYDIHALGDTIDRTTVNFNTKVATVISGDNGKRYIVNLNKIWPKR